MKKVIIFMLMTITVSLFAEVHFSGELKPEVIFNIPGEDGYESPLNPGNILGMGDVMFRNEIHLKLDQQSESAALDLWLQIGQYPIADMLAGTAAILSSTDPAGPALTSAVEDLAYASNSYLYTASLLRANASWMPASELKFTLGRQSYLTGYGYGWNPSDLANPPKDPTDPQAYLRGVDGLTFQADPLSWIGIKAYGLLPSQGFSWNYEDLLAGAEMTFQATSMEFKLSGLYGGVEKDSDEYDLYPHAGAAAFFVDLFGLGIYGEGVVRSRSRRNVPDASAAPSVLENEIVYSALAGMEYYFSSGLVGAVEYFYNGEGWDDDQRDDYASALDLMSTGPDGDYMGLYTPQYFARHYILLNLMIPWYARDSSFNANIIYSPDSQALFVTPSAVFNMNYEGTLVSELWYSGQYSLDDSKKNEAWLSPVNHSILLNLRYYY